MASCITSQWSNSTSPQIRLTVTGSNASSKVHRLSWKLEYVGHGYAPRTSRERSYGVVIDGETVASGNYDINGKAGTYTIASGTKDVNRGSSNRNISFSLSFAFNLTWSGIYSGTRSASGSYTVPSVPYNTYSFNANGGTGAPGSVTKVGGVDFIFPSGKPTRTGYTFKGWNNTEINNGAIYQPGQTVGGLPDKSIEWWANWQINTYTVKYNANGGSGAPGQQTKTYGTTLTLSSTKPTRTNYNFKGWGTSAGATTVAYAAGGSYTKNASITLYAIWELAYKNPSITNVKADRCNSGGTLDDEGTYGKVTFSWSIDSSATLSSIRIGYKLNTASSYTYITVSASGKSGNVSKVIGGSLNTESQYDIQVIVTDSKGNSSYTTTIGTTEYLVDFRPGGGMAIGKVAQQDGLLDINYQVLLRKGFLTFPTNTLDSDNVADWGNERNCVHYFDNTTTNIVKPSAYGVLINITSNSGSLIKQIWGCLDNGDLFYRSGSVSKGDWVEDWTRILDAGNYTAYAASKTHNHTYVGTMNDTRFASGWIGFYASATDAKNSANRKGWMGYNATNTFKMQNDRGGFEFEVAGTSGIEYKHSNQCFIDFHNQNSTADYTHRLLCQTNSNIIAYPGVTNGSDRRWKKDEAIMDPIFLNILKQLKTKTFRFINADKNLRIGFIAQDVLEVMDNEEIVDQPIVQQNEEDGFYGVDYGQITSLLVAGWQEHEKTITELNTEISILKEEINDLKDIIGELKSMVKGDE